MDMSYLPNILDQTLRCFIDNFGLTSWKICGGKSNNATVVLRFGSCNLNQQDQGNHTTYRRKPPSGTERDRQRIQQHKSNMPNQLLPDNDMQDADISNATEFIPGAPMHGCAPLLENSPLPTLPQVDGMCDSTTSMRSTVVDNLSRSPTHDMFQRINEGNERNAECGVIAPQNTADLKTGADSASVISDHTVQSDNSQIIDSGQTSSEDTDASDSDSVNDPIQCRHCSCILGQSVNQWYKCTYCSNAESHYDICVQCYESKYHCEHVQSMTLFHDPVNGNELYCDSCGYEFSKNDRIYECIECKKETNGSFLFEMCRQCYNKGLHSIHQCHLRRVRGKIV